jgi:hypothetical protein
MSGQLIATGLHVSGANAANINVGFIPDTVIMMKAAAIPSINVWCRMKVCAFTGGGTRELVAGDIIQGATSPLVRAQIQKVHVTGGTWAGGNAAGFFFWQDKDQNGVFGAENVNLLDPSSTIVDGGGILALDVATVTAQAETFNFALDSANPATGTALTSVTPANGIQPYVGAAGTDAAGFSTTNTLATANDVWFWIAIRGTFTV